MNKHPYIWKKCTFEQTNTHMHELMNEWMNEVEIWTNKRTYEWTNKFEQTHLNEQMKKYLNKCTFEQTNKVLNVLISEWTNIWMNNCMSVSETFKLLSYTLAFHCQPSPAEGEWWAVQFFSSVFISVPWRAESRQQVWARGQDRVSSPLQLHTQRAPPSLASDAIE